MPSGAIAVELLLPAVPWWGQPHGRGLCDDQPPSVKQQPINSTKKSFLVPVRCLGLCVRCGHRERKVGVDFSLGTHRLPSPPNPCWANLLTGRQQQVLQSVRTARAADG